MPQTIAIRNARTNNLQGIDLEIPHGQFVALCGVSGAGKSSLAIQTLFAEGQRRYIETLSPYTRQHMERIDRPPADEMVGIPPSVCLKAGHSKYGRRARVGSVTDVYQHLATLFAKCAVAVCPQCHQQITREHPDSLAECLQALEVGTRLLLGVRLRDWGQDCNWRTLSGMGFSRAIRDGVQVRIAELDLSESRPFDDNDYLVVDRWKARQVTLDRVRDSIEAAFEIGRGTIWVWSERPWRHGAEQTTDLDGQRWHIASASRSLRCIPCDVTFPEPSPHLFSDHHPVGACPQCEGFGDVAFYDIDRIVPNPDKSLRAGALAPWNSESYRHELDALLALPPQAGIDLDVPFSQLTAEQVTILWRGLPEYKFKGLDGFFAWLERRKYKMHLRVFAARWRSYRQCTLCLGSRRVPQAHWFRVNGTTLPQMEAMPIVQILGVLTTHMPADGAGIPAALLDQITRRLGFLCEMGLSYLALDRPMRSLSRGESRRVQLTTMLSSSLVNLLCVLDEPSLSLHPRDSARLANSVASIHHRGNTVLLVDHEPQFTSLAERVVVLGPAAGDAGGRVVADGRPHHKDVAHWLNYETASPHAAEFPGLRDARTASKLTLSGARGANLKGVDLKIPLGCLVAVCGVSGAGKTSLIEKTLYPALANSLGVDSSKPLPFNALAGWQSLKSCTWIDASPPAKSSRSNPATYVKAFDEIRRAFAETNDAKSRKFTISHFSFNSKLGQCPKCCGEGQLRVDLHFLADVRVSCDECGGRRYREEILTVRHRDRTIDDVLQMTARQAFGFFHDRRSVQHALKPLLDVGLEYVRLGQPLSELSAGENQRLKLATLIGQTKSPRTLFLLDEPSSGLHALDILKLVDCLESLLSVGHSLLVVDNRLPLLARMDWLIELGPGAGPEGGNIVAEGRPSELAANANSPTGLFLKQIFGTNS